MNVVAMLNLDMVGYHGSEENVVLEIDEASMDLNMFLGQLIDSYQPKLDCTTSSSTGGEGSLLMGLGIIGPGLWQATQLLQ